MVLNEPIPDWGSILTLGLTILGSILRALTCPSVEKPYSLAGQICGTPYIFPKFSYNAHVVDPSTNCSMTVWSLKSGRIFASRENFQLITKYICTMQANHAPCSVWPLIDRIFAIRENLHLSRENLHSLQSPASRPDSGWSSAHIDRPDSGWSSTHVDPSPSQRWSRHGNVNFEAKKLTRWRHYNSITASLSMGLTVIVYMALSFGMG